MIFTIFFSVIVALVIGAAFYLRDDVDVDKIKDE